MNTVGEIQKKLFVTKEMVGAAKDYFSNSNQGSSYALIRNLAAEHGAKSLGECNSIEEIASSVSWHNAGVEAIRILIGEAEFIPISNTLYKPSGRCRVVNSTGGGLVTHTSLEEFDVSILLMPVCEEVAKRPSGSGT